MSNVKQKTKVYYRKIYKITKKIRKHQRLTFIVKVTTKYSKRVTCKTPHTLESTFDIVTPFRR